MLMTAKCHQKFHESVVLDCSCSSTDHAIVLHHYQWDDENYPQLDLNMQMAPSSGFWRRVWIALKYVFGGASPCGYGHWNETGLHPREARQLRDVLDRFLKASPAVE
jgi:hypothetical protein